MPQNNEGDDGKEDLQDSSEKQNPLQGKENKVEAIGEDIEELEALAENEKYDDSEILDTEDIEGETNKSEADAEQKESDQSHQILSEKIDHEKKINMNDEDSDQKISRIASQVSEIMEEFGEEINA
jgi:hypothetical protein